MPEGIDIVRLGERLRRTRVQRNKTLEEVKQETGVSVPTLSRIERGAAKDLESGTLLALTKWIGTSAEKFGDTAQPPAVRGGKVSEDVPEILELHLRADRKLDKKTATLLAKMFRTAYETACSEVANEQAKRKR